MQASHSEPGAATLLLTPASMLPVMVRMEFG